jgi:hypothetical protein
MLETAAAGRMPKSTLTEPATLDGIVIFMNQGARFDE